jgi:hypothetical protein
VASHQVTVNFDKLAEIGRTGVLPATAFVGLGQKAWTGEVIRSVRIEAPFSHQMLPDPLPEPLANEVRAEFKSWIIGNALLEIERNLALFFAECERVLRYVALHGRKLRDVDIAALDQERDENLRAKTERLRDSYGISGQLAASVGGWTTARNCLSHNNGVVRLRDVTLGDDRLVVRWRRLEIAIAGTVVPPDKLVGFRVEKDSHIELRTVDGFKEFAVGSKIDFSEQDITELCLTAYFRIDEYVKQISDRVQAIVAKPPE